MAPPSLAKGITASQRTSRPSLASWIMKQVGDYQDRLATDFSAGADQSAHGLGDIIERGNFATGLPRMALGGMGWLGSPVSAAVSPLLNPILEPVGRGIHDYVGQPIENATGYPADITDQAAMMALLGGAGKAVHVGIPHAAKLADRVGLKPPGDGVYGSGPVPTDGPKPFMTQSYKETLPDGTTRWVPGTLRSSPQTSLRFESSMSPADIKRYIEQFGEPPTPRARNEIVTNSYKEVYPDGTVKFVPGTLRAKRPQSGPVPTDGITAYHGSPHDFDQFSMEKIGTGEGAQAYGHGLYFADSEGVAKSYREALSPLAAPKQLSPFHTQATNDLVAKDMALRNSIDFLQDKVDRRVASPEDVKDLQAFKSERDAHQKQHSGTMYQVHINAQPHEFLDWDKPLSEQPESVRQVLRNITGDSLQADPRRIYDTGEQFIRKREGVAQSEYPGATKGQMPPSGFNASAEVAKDLKAQGIKGIRYLDQGSRDGGKGTYNYVVFDDKLITILKKYGIPMTAGAGGAMMISGHDMPNDIASQMGGS